MGDPLQGAPVIIIKQKTKAPPYRCKEWYGFGGCNKCMTPTKREYPTVAAALPHYIYNPCPLVAKAIY